MNDIKMDDVEKVDAYFKVIDERIIGPIKNTDIKKSCTATLVLIFAGIDGLGKLICEGEDYDNPGKRFRHFLKKMGEKYESKLDTIWKIRNSLVHNGINIESYMFATSNSSFAFEHLSTPGPDGFIYIDTTQFLLDFSETVQRLRQKIGKNYKIFKLAANRIEWFSEDPQEYSKEEILRPTPPPPVYFIHSVIPKDEQDQQGH